MISKSISVDDVYQLVKIEENKILSDNELFIKFIKFCSQHTQFSLKNVILLFIQRENSFFITSNYVLSELENEGVSLKKDEKPVVLLYPFFSLKDKKLGYTLVPFFPFEVCSNEKYVLEDLSVDKELENLHDAVVQVLGHKIYFQDNLSTPAMSADKKSFLIPENYSEQQKIDALIKYYARRTYNDNTKINRIMEDLIVYIYYNRFVPVSQAFVPSLSAFYSQSLNNKTQILEDGFKHVKHITDRMEKPHFVIKGVKNSAKEMSSTPKAYVMKETR